MSIKDILARLSGKKPVAASTGRSRLGPHLRETGLMGDPAVRAKAEEYALLGDIKSMSDIASFAETMDAGITDRFRSQFMRSVHTNAVELARLGLEPSEETPTGRYVQRLRALGTYDRILDQSPS